MTGPDLTLTVNADVRDAQKGLADVQDGVTKMFAGITGTVMGSKAFSFLKDLGGDVLDALAGYGDQFDALSDQLGSDAAQAFTDGFAANVEGANIQEAMGIGSELAKTVTGALGLAGDGARELTETLAQGVLDIAASTDASAEQVTGAVTAFLQGKDKALAKTLGLDGDYVKSLVKQKMATDKLNEAQARQAVLTELMGERAGEAKADTETLSGTLKELTDEFADTGTSLLQDLLPHVMELATWSKGTLVPAVKELARWFGQNKTLVLGVAAGVAGLVVVFQLLSGALAVIGAVQAFVGVLKSLEVIQRISTAAQWLWNAAMTANPVGVVVMAIAALVAGLIWFFTQTETGKELWATFVAVLTDLWTQFAGFMAGVWESVAGFFTAAAGKVTSAWTGAVDWFAGIPERIRAFFTGAPTWLAQAGADVLNGLLDGVENIFGKDVRTFFTGMLNKILRFLGDPLGALKSAGRDLITGLWNGINDKVGWIKDKISGFVGSVETWFKKFFGIASPSKMLRALGRWLPQGLGLGIDDDADKPLAAARRLGDKLSATFESFTLGRPVMAIDGPGGGGNTYHLDVHVPVTANLADVGREVVKAIAAYEAGGGRRRG